MTKESNSTIISIPQGKLLDFIDNVTLRDETPEEYVRQEIVVGRV